jgi:hypothetical protein
MSAKVDDPKPHLKPSQYARSHEERACRVANARRPTHSASEGATAALCGSMTRFFWKNTNLFLWCFAPCFTAFERPLLSVGDMQNFSRTTQNPEKVP